MRDGKYGPYVNWGKVNATLPKGKAADSVTMEEALVLIADKAGKMPAKGGKAPAKAKAAKTTKAAKSDETKAAKPKAKAAAKPKAASKAKKA